MTAAERAHVRGAYRIAIAVALFVAVTPAAASAQFYIGRDVPRAGSVEIGAGVVWSQGYDLGSVSAEETRNTGTGTGPFVLFTADSRVAPAVGALGRVGVYLAQAVSLEGSVMFARPILSARLAGDAESAPDVTAKETLTRIIADGSAVLHLNGLSFAQGRGVPFVLGGGGYIRELHEKNEVIDTGREYHAGAGFHYWSGQGKHRVGFRTDVGVSIRSGGVDTNEKKHTVPTASVSVAYLF